MKVWSGEEEGLERREEGGGIGRKRWLLFRGQRERDVL